MLRFVVLLLLIVSVGVGAILLLRPPRSQEIRATISAAEMLGGSENEGFARAMEQRRFEFPADHGPHPEFRTEWWYVTGNLDSEEGNHFGFELTIFRSALSPDSAERGSQWATRQVYMAHFALTDVAGERFYSFERFSRGALGLAGAQSQPFRVWLEDWVIAATGDTGLPMRITAAQDGVAVDLTLSSAKPPVLQGQNGLSQKGTEPGNASYYYSLTRMPTHGTLSVAGRRFSVTGLSWMDREWSTSALDQDQAGWDWFALHLADGRDLMYYQIRRHDGSVDPLSSGRLVAADGTSQPLSKDDVQLEVLDQWTSPRDGTTYPARWRLRIPTQQVDLELIPYLADQELQVSARYWEGAIQVFGAGGEPLGNGYAELVGYGPDGGDGRGERR